MPKSKVRGGKKQHRARISERNLIKKRTEEKAKRDFMSQMQKIQEDAMKAQEAEVVDVDEMGDVGEFSLDDAEIIEDVEIVQDTEIVEENKPEPTV